VGEGRAGTVERDAALVRGLVDWFGREARRLPWRRRGRASRRDAYETLVSEVMLQQTQVERVAPAFERFVARFPDIGALARAREQSVLAAWNGLGYYRRAKHLHGAARAIVREHGGEAPRSSADLQALPGIGRYTAGAIASIAYDEAASLVDGNVGRVLLRIEGRAGSIADRETERWAWQRADELVKTTDGLGLSVGDFNESLMELGATVCTPRGASCGRCPVRGYCRARAEGKQEEIPSAKPRAKRRALYCASFVVWEGARVLVEQRGEQGLWREMWQAPTVESDAPVDAAAMARELLGADGAEHAGAFTHVTTHRDVHFDVWRASGRVAKGMGAAGSTLRFVTTARARALPMSNAQRRVLFELGAGEKERTR